MIYYINETEIAQFKTIKGQIHAHYCKEDALRLEKVIVRVLQCGFIDESDLYELIDVLPRILPRQVNDSQETREDITNDWSVYMDEHRARYKYEMEKLYQVLSNWIFMHNAVYRRNKEILTSPIKKAKFRSNDQGIKK